MMVGMKVIECGTRCYDDRIERYAVWESDGSRLEVSVSEERELCLGYQCWAVRVRYDGRDGTIATVERDMVEWSTRTYREALREALRGVYPASSMYALSTAT
jgi:hypothetical protein